MIRAGARESSARALVNLYAKLRERAAVGKPLRIGLIGAGKFGSMFLAQLRHLPGMHLVGIVDLSPEAARGNLERVGWAAPAYAARSLDEAARQGSTHVGDDWRALVAHPAVDIIVESTGNPIAAVEHLLYAFEDGKHVVNVTVEADALCGPALARRARSAGIIYSLAYGDQPALICELVDWARTAGFEVIAAGRGHKWRPAFADSTPDTVWDHYGLTPEQARAGGLNAKMFNSFLDGSKPAIECTAVCNATGLTAPPEGLRYPPASIDEIADVCRPAAEGGVLSSRGEVEVVSSLRADGSPIDHDIRFGVFVVIEGDTEYVRSCFREYMVRTDSSGRYACMYRRWHLIGLEVGISVASVGLRAESTGGPVCFNADAVAVAKRELLQGEMLDGEGGYTVRGLLLPARTSVQLEALPLGLAHQVRVERAVSRGSIIRFRDVRLDPASPAVRLRQELRPRTD